MIRILFLALWAVFSFAPAARAAEMQVLLELVSYTDTEPTARVTLYGDNVVPNRVGVNDRFRLEVDGRRMRVPRKVLADLNARRTQFASDSRTGGIVSEEAAATCLLGGPALGEVLSVRYVTYDENGIVTSSTMREVLSAAGNCLFTRSILPRDVQAIVGAAQAVATMQTLRDLAR